MGRVIHFEIHADDSDRAEKFYTSLFGWKVQRFDGPIDYRLLNTGSENPGIDGAIVPRRGEGDGDKMIGFVCTVQVDDIGATEKQAVEAGGEQVVERQEIPGVGFLAYFKDTEGNIFGAMQPTYEGEPKPS